jgi:hypothetical protein
MVKSLWFRDIEDNLMTLSLEESEFEKIKD